jgi:hypothetical protein
MAIDLKSEDRESEKGKRRGPLHIVEWWGESLRR